MKNHYCFSIKIYPFFFPQQPKFTEETPSVAIVLQVIITIGFPPVVTARLVRLVYASVLKLLSVSWRPCRVTVGQNPTVYRKWCRDNKTHKWHRNKSNTDDEMSHVLLLGRWHGYSPPLKSRVCGNCSPPFSPYYLLNALTRCESICTLMTIQFYCLPTLKTVRDNEQHLVGTKSEKLFRCIL